MRIRPAETRDLAGIFAIYDREVLHGTCTFDTEPKTPQQRVEWFNTSTNRESANAAAAAGADRYPILVAEDDDAAAGAGVLGWARLYQWSPRPAYNRTAENAVYVPADARGRGVGRSLLLDLLRRGRDAGVRVVIARVVEGNPASLALHESVGFTTIGVMHGVGEKFGRVLDVRLMERQLADGSDG